MNGCKPWPTRSAGQITDTLRAGPRCACQLVDELAVPAPLLSHHMKVLCNVELVHARKLGRRVEYTLDLAALDELARRSRKPGQPQGDIDGGGPMTATLTPVDGHVTARLSKLNRLLPLWIGLAMVGGLLLGRAFPDLNDWLDKVKIGTVSLPIAIGLLAMMYPVLAKVRYGRIGAVTADRRPIALSLILNWVVGPALMFTLAWLLLPDLPELRTGLIIVGLARCIAMVLIWNDLAFGSRELAAVLVAVNSLFQIVMYSVLGWFYLTVLPGWLGLDTAALDVSLWEIAKSVLIFLGIPLAAGYLTRTIGEARKGTEWYEQRFIPRIAPIALWGLLFTIVVLFALQGEQITAAPFDVARVAVPLLIYFAVMWTGSFVLGYRLRFDYERNTSIAFTAAGNNFELAIAVAIAVFGVTSGQALAGTIGPLIEVPTLVALVYVALWARRRYYDPAGQPRRGEENP